jgi:hypothetical protein
MRHKTRTPRGSLSWRRAADRSAHRPLGYARDPPGPHASEIDQSNVTIFLGHDTSTFYSAYIDRNIWQVMKETANDTPIYR